ncbi:TetR/AcrR family transcriptional regulator [Streptomyces ipomoeae]|uniref:TetR/AcrR family transcriptional regulator n=1 Tax=Streptomyces ipomoeae TaxID=103232 RepID=UPI0011469E4E|nr:TetR/AcrR family transcriptional regulator [Streptomyces ipomoeae]MDX2939625.1 TetR/AcrR family transcriptional regulator [Streptomyces ipomoeae]TQE31945.1 TetR/AcrR family transcriptional regulator [Streptomyces ipomoeae]
MTSAAPAKLGDTPRGRRSRITPEREAELYAAVLDLLREVGYDALTMDAIVARTRCSKATLYRQWAGKPELVAKALRHQKPATLAGIDTGSLRGDFEAAVDQMDDRQLARDTALMRGLSQAVHAHPDLLQALRDLFVDPELTGLDVFLARAVERGEIAADAPALAYVPHLLLGAVISQPLFEDRLADSAFMRDYIEAVVLPALGL